MKNERTPRTLAECQFTVGHAEARLAARSAHIADIVVAVIFGLSILAVPWVCSDGHGHHPQPRA